MANDVIGDLFMPAISFSIDATIKKPLDDIRLGESTSQEETCGLPILKPDSKEDPISKCEFSRHHLDRKEHYVPSGGIPL